MLFQSLVNLITPKTRPLVALTLALSLLAVTPACGGTQRVEILDEGSICVTPSAFAGPSDATMMYEADDTIAVTVLMDGCLSSSCDTARDASCEIVLDGTTLSVTSFFAYDTPTGNVACTSDCGFLHADCESAPLPAGDYVLEYAGASQPLTVPSAVAYDCDGEFPFIQGL